MVSEHHAADDGYLPSPLLVGVGVRRGHRRVPITISALLVNLYEPVRLAEDIAVLDHLSKGRVSYTFGLGYRPVEYELYGRSWADPRPRHRGADHRGCSTPGRRHGHARAVLPAAPVPLLRRRLAGRREAGGPAGAQLPAAARRRGAQGAVRRDLPGRRPRARLRAAGTGRRAGERLLRRAARRVLGALRPPPAGRRGRLPGVARRGRVVRRRPLAHRRGDARGRASTSCSPPTTSSSAAAPARSGWSPATRRAAACPPEPSWESLRLVCETVLPAVRNLSRQE